MSDKLICGNCGYEFYLMDALGNYWFRCTNCGYTSPCFSTIEEAEKFVKYYMGYKKTTRNVVVCENEETFEASK